MIRKLKYGSTIVIANVIMYFLIKFVFIHFFGIASNKNVIYFGQGEKQLIHSMSAYRQNFKLQRFHN